MGTLYYGDNLDILRRYLKDQSVDLVYLDPPFNSAQNYNAFFHEKDGTEAAIVDCRPRRHRQQSHHARMVGCGWSTVSSAIP